MEKQLEDSISKNDFTTVEQMVTQNPSLLSKKLSMWPVLHFAVAQNNLQMVKLIVEKLKLNQTPSKQGINLPAAEGFTPLHVACDRGSLAIVEYLLSEGADLLAQNNEGWTILHAAAQNGQLDIIKYLIQDTNMDVDIMDGRRSTPLLTAAFHGHLNVVEFLLGDEIRKVANLHAKDVCGATSFICASMSNNLEIMKFLKNKGAFIYTAPDTFLGNVDFSSLHMAAMYNNIEMIDYCIDELGIDVNIGKPKGLTPLHGAGFVGAEEAFDYLVKRGADEHVTANFSNVATEFKEAKRKGAFDIDYMPGLTDAGLLIAEWTGNMFHITPTDFFELFHHSRRSHSLTNSMKLTILKPFAMALQETLETLKEFLDEQQKNVKN